MEYVTHVHSIDGADIDRERVAATDRLARGPEMRTLVRRDAEQMFDLFRAAKGRLPILAVVMHECRHDEGIGDCRSAVTVEG